MIHPHLRPATPDDVSHIFAMVKELAEFEKLADQVDSTEDSLSAALFGENPRIFGTIAEAAGGRIVGFTLWYYTFSSFRGRHGIWIEDLYVRPDWRSKGFGKMLLADLAKRCIAENLARLEWTVLDWNQKALAFYRREGAQQLDEWRMCRVDGSALWRMADQGL